MPLGERLATTATMVFVYKQTYHTVRNMPVFAVFRENVACKYKSTLFSKATAVLFATSIIQLVIPLFISYRTGEFWFKTANYQEQPNVRFKHEYILLLETDKILRSLVCGTGIGYDDLRSHCLLKYIEKDTNHDGKPDTLNFNVLAPLHQGEKIQSVTLVLLMDLHLDDLCVMRTKSLLVAHYTSGLPRSQLHIVGDLRLTQTKPLKYQCVDSSRMSLQLDGETDLKEIIFSKSACNVSLDLINERIFWSSGYEGDKPFAMSVEISIPDATVLYQPGILQLFKWAWIQYFSIFIVFSYFVYLLKRFIYCNNLVWTYKDKPWKAY